MASKGKGRHADKKGRSKYDEQFLPIPYSMASSDAWRCLSGAAVKVYVELRSRYNGSNNGRLFLSLNDAARLLGIGKQTAMRAFDDLEEKGFIVMTKRGNWYGRTATEWRVTDRSHDGNHPTNDWKQWHAPKPKNKTRFRGGPIGWDDGSVAEP